MLPRDRAWPRMVAGIVRRARSTIWKVLHRHGLSRLRRSPRQTYRRYEWSRPGRRCCTSTPRTSCASRAARSSGDR